MAGPASTGGPVATAAPSTAAWPGAAAAQPGAAVLPTVASAAAGAVPVESPLATPARTAAATQAAAAGLAVAEVPAVESPEAAALDPMPPPTSRPTYRSSTLPARAVRTRNARRRLPSAWAIDAQDAPETATAQVGQDLPVPPAALASLARRTNNVPVQPRHATPRPTSVSDASLAATARVRVRRVRAGFAQR
jgi:ribonuclease E